MANAQKKHGLTKFQSSPAPEGGRYNGRRLNDYDLRLFQSSPAPEGGRYAGG